MGVVIVNYNSGEFLGYCLDSLNRSLVPLNIVVVDNASVDESLDGLESRIADPHQLKIIKNRENLGFSRAVNIGVAEIGNRYFCILNPDTEIFPGTLVKLQQVLSSNREIGIAGATVFNSDGSEQRGCRRHEPTFMRSMVTSLGLDKLKWGKFEGIDQTGDSFPIHPVEVDAVSGAAMMVRREMFDELGGMDEDYFLHCEDLDLCRRVRDSGSRVMFCPGASVFHQKGGSKVSSLEVERHKHKGMLLYNKKHDVQGQGKMHRMGLSVLVFGHFLLSAVLCGWHSLFARNEMVAADTVNPMRGLLQTAGRKLVVVTGGKSDVGDFLLDGQHSDKFHWVAVSRSHTPYSYADDRVTWINLEFFRKCDPRDLGDVYAWVNLAPIWTTSSLAKVFHRFKPSQLITFSSTSIEGKAESQNDNDQEVVSKLTDGENWVQDYAKKFKVPVTILRPTLIYGGPRNQNINFIARIAKTLRTFPLVGEGAGKRQPVHAEDLSDCVVNLLQKSPPSAGTFNLGGGERLSYRDMVARVFESLEMQPRFLTVSPSFATKLVSVLGKLPGLEFLNPGMLERMDQDLVYSLSKARKELQYSPGKFRP